MYGPPEPDTSSILGTICHLNTEELKKLLNEDDRLNEFVKDIPQMRSADSEKEILLISNKSLAEFNLSREPRLRQSKQRLCETYDRALQVFGDADKKKRQLEELSKKHSLDVTLAVLQAAAAESEEQSEGLADKFLEGGIDVETFLNHFHGKRKVVHLRRIKADKLNELVSAATYRPPRPVTTNGNWEGSQGVYAASNLRSQNSVYASHRM